MDKFQTIVTALAGTAALIGVGFAVLRATRRGLRRWSNFFEDWNGEPARPGHLQRPGVMERLANTDAKVDHLDAHQTEMLRLIHANTALLGRHTVQLEAIDVELHPNGGATLRDDIKAIRHSVDSAEGTS